MNIQIYNKIKAFVTKYRAIIILLVLEALLAGAAIATQHHSTSKLEALLETNQHLHTEIETSRIQHQSAVKALKQLSDEHTKLEELAARLQTEVQYKNHVAPVIKEVIVTRTVIEAQESSIKVDELPIEHRFILSPGIEIARFRTTNEGYLFETRNLSIRNSIVVGEHKATALLQIASSAEPDKYYDIPIDDFKFKNTDEDIKLFKPQVMLGVRAGLSAKPQLTGMVMLTMLHPMKCLDVAGIIVAANTEVAQFGIAPVSYNIGCNLPVVDDLWLTADAYIDIYAQPGAGIGIGSKF